MSQIEVTVAIGVADEHLEEAVAALREALGRSAPELAPAASAPAAVALQKALEALTFAKAAVADQRAFTRRG